MPAWLKRHELIIFILLGVVLLRIPTLLEPYWYGDEGIYLTIGQALRRGTQLYTGIYDNKPPFLYLVTAAVDGYQFWFRLVLLAWNVATVALFWQLAKRWFTPQSGAVGATILFALLTNLPPLEGNIANAELYFLLPTIGAFWWLYSGRSALVGGIILGLAALFKMPAVLEAGVWPMFWLATAEARWWRKSLLLGVGALLPLLVSLVYFNSVGTLQPYLVATGLRNIPYLSSWQAPVSLTTRMVVLLLGIGGLGLWRRNLDHKTILVGWWWLVALFAALLSGRPYPHYLLQMTPALALGTAILIGGKLYQQLVVGGLTALLVVVVLVFRFYHYPVVAYYANFMTWLGGQHSREEYFDRLAAGTSRNYAISQLIVAGSAATEKIFVWGDQPMIYALTRRQPVGRYTAKYHIFDFGAQAETLVRLTQTPPRYLVSFSDEAGLPGLASLLAQKYRLEKSFGDARVYRRVL